MKRETIPHILIIGALSIMLSFEAYSTIVFTKSGSPYYITNDYIVDNHDTIFIEHGATLILGPFVNIITNGVIMIDGIPDDPVSILPEIEGIGWGKIEFNSPGKTSYIQHAVIVDGSILSWYCNITLSHVAFINNQDLPWNNPILFVRNASVNIVNSSIHGNYKGEGFQMLNSETVLIKNCFFSKIPDAVELTNVTGGYISHNWFEDIPDDAIDLNNCTNTIIDSNIIINAGDRGIELGSENNGNSENILVRRNVLIGCNVGVILKEESYGHLINNTFYGNNIGVVCIEDNGSKTGSLMNVQNCIFSNSVENDVYKDSNSTLSLNYCLSDTEVLPGENNIMGDPQFTDPSIYDFSLQANSPCINTGNPELPFDPDFTISDIGAFYYNTDTTSIFDKNDIFRSLSIYPNPFHNEFTISFDSENPSEIIVELYTSGGIKIPAIINKINSAANTIRVKTINILKTNTVVICRISINNNSSSFVLIHN